MKLIRYGKFGLEKPGLEIKGVRYDVSNLVSDYDEYFFESIGISKLMALFDLNKATIISKEERLGCPVKKPGKIICIGLLENKTPHFWTRFQNSGHSLCRTLCTFDRYLLLARLVRIS